MHDMHCPVCNLLAPRGQCDCEVDQNEDPTMPRFRTQQLLRITNAIVYVSAIVILLLDLLVWRPN